MDELVQGFFSFCKWVEYMIGNVMGAVMGVGDAALS